MNYKLYKTDIDKIILDDELISEEKLDLLEKYLAEVANSIKTAKHEITKALMYCPECDTYYRKQSFEIDYPKYTCPKGHIFIDDYGC